MSPQGELLSRGEAAERAGVHPNTVLSWERKGLIKVKQVRVGGKSETRIPVSELAKVAGARKATARTRRPVREDPAEELEEHPTEVVLDRRTARSRLRRRAARDRAARNQAEKLAHDAT